MAVENKQLIPGRYAEDSLSVQYTAPADTTVMIDKFSVLNDSANNVKFTAHVVEPSGSASAANRVIDDKTIGVGETYLCPELVGRAIEAGGFISTQAETASTLVIMSSGREITPTSA